MLAEQVVGGASVKNARFSAHHRRRLFPRDSVITFVNPWTAAIGLVLVCLAALLVVTSAAFLPWLRHGRVGRAFVAPALAVIGAALAAMPP